MGEKGEFAVDLKDEVVRGSIVLQDGKMMWPPPAIEMPAPAPSKAKEIVKPPEQSPFNAAAWETGLTAGMKPNDVIATYIVSSLPSPPCSYLRQETWTSIPFKEK